MCITQKKSMRLLRRSGCALKTVGQTTFILCRKSSRCIGVVPPCAHAVARPLTEHHPCCCPAAFHTWLPSAARTRLRTSVAKNARHVHDEQNKGGRVATHTANDKGTDVYGDKREEDTLASSRNSRGRSSSSSSSSSSINSSSSSTLQDSRVRALPAFLWWYSRIYFVSVPYRAGW